MPGPEVLPPPPPAPPAPEPVWSTARKVAFRLLFVLGGGILLLSVYGNVGVGAVWYYSGIWWLLAQIGSYVARGEGVEVYLSSNGDLLWNWCWHLGWIVVSLVIVAVWTLLDRSRPNYRSLLGMLRSFAFLGLALSMIYYGLVKVFPMQMGFMKQPAHQLELVGDASIFNVLWGFMGASTPYSIATGAVELAAGLLLLFRRTQVLGLLLALVATTQVFLMNLFYDVPVKLVSGELVVVTVALLVPYLPNLLRVGLNRPAAEPVPPLPVPGPRWLSITGTVFKYVAAGLIVLTGVAQGAVMTYVINTPRSPLDGVWTATSVSIDGAPAGLLQRDPAPWSNVAITLRGSSTITALDEIGKGYDSVVTQTSSGYTTTWKLVQSGDVLELREREGSAPLRVTARLDGDRLRLSADIDGKRVEGLYERRYMERERSHFRLVQPDWASEGSRPEQGGS
ncbi:hypothetical protein FK529_11670 [Tsukamurella asaccharolytica]|uniref:DoxX family protein n=1 Tax=Tsukamurella asaccharolytica TaxID=2592067 RepID=A0A5C5R8Z3_9ACTN|nr:hypothetical protein FK529_11670 [Tsukamurella asaccharolytica]